MSKSKSSYHIMNSLSLCPQNGCSALMHAVNRGLTELARLLLKRGAEVDQQNMVSAG